MLPLEDTLNIARSKLNYYAPGPPRNSIFGQWAMGVPGPYCDCFVSWVFDQAGFGQTFGKQTYCPATVNWWRNRGLLFSVPQAGDQAIYFWNGQYAHTGIVERVDGDQIIAIEGNTSEGPLDPNGGKVLRKIRTWRGTRTVFGRPPYAPPKSPRLFGINPPLIMRPIVADYFVGDGWRLVADNGDTYNFFGAPYQGTEPGRHDHDPVVFEPIVDAKADPNGPGGWLLAASGAVYALGAQYHGGANGKDYFKGFTAAQLELTPDGRYRIQATNPDTGGYGPDF